MTAHIDSVANSTGSAAVTTDGGDSLAPYTYKKTGLPDTIRIDHKVTNEGASPEAFSIEVVVLDAGLGTRITDVEDWTHPIGIIGPGLTWESTAHFITTERINFYVSFGSEPGMIPNGAALSGIVFCVLESRLKDSSGTIIARRRLNLDFTGAIATGQTGGFYNQTPSPAHFVVEYGSAERFEEAAVEPAQDVYASQSCASCACPAGEVSAATTGSADIRISLGPEVNGGASQYLRLDLESPDPLVDHYAPEFLRRSFADGYEVIREAGSGDILQFAGPLSLANVVDPDPADESYSLEFFLRAAAATPNPDGTYPVSGPPHTVVTIENPDVSGATNHQLRLTRVFGADSDVHEFSYDAITDKWTQISEGGARVESLEAAVLGDTDSDGFDEYRETHIVKDGAGVVYSRVETTYEEYDFGSRRVEEVVDPGGRALRRQWEYYSDAVGDGANYAQLKRETDQSGSWRRYEYGNLGVTKIVSQYLAAPETAAENLSRVTEITYNPDGTIPKPATQTVERLLGQEIGRRYRLQRPDGFDDIVCQSAGAAWDAPENLVTVSRDYASGAFEGDPKSVRNPDGTMALFSYAIGGGGDKTTTIRTGRPNMAGDDIIEGTQTLTITNREGYTIATTVTDIASGLVVDEILATQIDEFGRPTEKTHLDETTELTVYGCCGVDSRTDRRGIITTLTDTGAVRTETRQGVTLTTSTAAVGAGPNAGGILRSVTRKGSDISLISLSEVETNAAGELIRSRDAAGEDTIFDVAIDAATGHTVRTTTFPDGATRVERFYPDGSLFTTGGTADYPRKYEYGVDAWGAFTKEIFLDGAGGESEWVKTCTDFAGRVSKTVRPVPGGGTAVSQSFYNNLNQLERSVDADGVTTLYGYDGRGRRTTLSIDRDGGDAIDFDGIDRIRKSDVAITTRGAEVVERTTERVWTTDNDALASATLSVTDRAVDGLDAWTDVGGLVTRRNIEYDGAGAWTETVTFPDGSEGVRQFANGRLASDALRDALAAPLLSTTYGYDPHGRLESVDDARNGVTSYTYYDDDRIETIETPAPGAGEARQLTRFTYDVMGRRDVVTLPDHAPGDPKQVDYDYFATGDLARVSGARAYTVDYGYTAQGRLATLATAGGTTSWTYFPESGQLEKKDFPDGSDVDYTYTGAGRIETRETQRGIVTTYGYNDAGQLATVAYSDATPGVAYGYNRLGQLDTVSRDGAVHALAYNAFGQLENEIITGGILDGVALDPRYDALRRRDRLTVAAGGSALIQSFAYDAASRLKTLTQGPHEAKYSYEPDAALMSGIEFRSGGALKATLTRQHDLLNRVETVASVSTGVNALDESFTYTYNDANQRTRVDLEDGDTWEYGYDGFGHVDDARKRDGGAAAYPGRQFTYTYDAVGNRTASEAGFQPLARATFYTPQSGDPAQYDTITRPGFVSVTGRADPAASVTVNGGAAARQGEFFSQELAVDNSGGAVLQQVDIEAVLGPDTDAITRSELIPAAGVAWQYDADGNLTNDGYRAFTWDGENRLTKVETNPGAVPAGAKEYKITFDYDHLGRRIAKQVYGRIAGAWVLARERKYIYDGWNCVAESEGADKLVMSYLWGLDHAGQSGGAPFAQGAGGVGGLLCVTKHRGPGAGAHFVTCDGNGNVTALVDAATGDASAGYEYDPFGNLLAETGPFASLNPFRFSTKYRDDVSGLYYYGYRHYDAATGRWLSRDPIGEEGGINLYGFVANDPLSSIDVLGLTAAAGTLPPSIWTFAEQRSAQAVLATGSQALASATGIVTVGVFTYEMADWVNSELGRLLRTRQIANTCLLNGCQAYSGTIVSAAIGAQIAILTFDVALAAGDFETARRHLEYLATAIDIIEILAEKLPSVCPHLGLPAGQMVDGLRRAHHQKLQRLSAAELSASRRGLGDATTSPWLLDNRASVRTHIETFREGGAWILTKEQYEWFIKGKKSIGDPSGQFITSKAYIDKIFAQGGGDLRKIESLLGFSPGHFASGGGLVRVNVNNPLLHNARLPTGFERGANQWFRWGGQTSGGAPEVVIDSFSSSDASFQFIGF